MSTEQVVEENVSVELEPIRLSGEYLRGLVEESVHEDIVINDAGEEVDISGWDLYVEELKALAELAAKTGDMELEFPMKGQPVELIEKVGREFKAATDKIMTIVDRGAEQIIVSWHGNNEV